MRARGWSVVVAVGLLLSGCGAETGAAAGAAASAPETTVLPARPSTGHQAVTAPPLTSGSDPAATGLTTTAADPTPTDPTPTAPSTVPEPPTSAAGETPPAPPPSTSSATSTSSRAPSVPTADGVVAGKVVVLDPGHNGANGANPSVINQPVDAGFGEMKPCNTTGTSTNDGYSEHRFNWEVTVKVKALLEAQGVTVILTRDSDDGVGPCVDKRAAVGNDNNADAVVSIHGDGSTQGNRGFFAMTSKRQPNGAQVADRSADLAAAVRDSLVGAGLATSNYIGSGGLTKRDDLAGLNLSTVPTTMLEMGNMRDSIDSALMTSDDGQNRMAAGIAQGILNYLGAH